jgi:hypothetical protein
MPRARAFCPASGNGVRPPSRRRYGNGNRSVFPSRPYVIFSTKSYMWRPATRLRRHPNVFPCFSPETGKRSRGFRRNSSSLRSFGKAGDLGFEPRLTAPEAVVLPLHQSPSGLRVRISPNLPYPTDFWPRFQDGRNRPLRAASEPITATICTSHTRPAIGITRAIDDSVGRALLPGVKVRAYPRRDVRAGEQRDGPDGASD